MPSSKPSSRRLPISTRAVLEPDGSIRRDLRVFCPKDDATLDIETCMTCPACVGLDARPDADGRPAVCCGFEGLAAERSARPVGSVLARFAAAVHVGALPLGHTPAPYGSPVAIVDDDLRIVGVFERNGSIRPDDGSLSVAIEEHVTLPAALSRMARHRQRSAPVVAASGVFVGAFDDLDALRALRDVPRPAR
ncbi:MAG TPA: CBS domain-containing protein [Polyangiaceae bacterium]